MDRKESLALLDKGPVAWEEWAEALRTEKGRLNKAGLWDDTASGDQDNVDANEPTRQWLRQAAIDLSGVRIDRDVAFGEWSFPGGANFDGAVFGGKAFFHDCGTSLSFVGSRFRKDVTFQDVEFGFSSFRDSVFEDGGTWSRNYFFEEASFASACFGGSVLMEGLRFAKRSDFSRVLFLDELIMRDGAFFGPADFSGAILCADTIIEDVSFAISVPPELEPYCRSA